MTEQYTVTEQAATGAVNRKRLRVSRTAIKTEQEKQKGKDWDSLSVKDQIRFIALRLGIVDDEGKVK